MRLPAFLTGHNSTMIYHSISILSNLFSVGCELLIPLLMRHLKFHLKDEETNRDKDEVKKEKIQAVEILTHILITVSNKHVSSDVP